MRLALLPVLTLPLWAGQSLITTTTNGTLTFPNIGGVPGAPYDNITSSRVEARLTNIQPCVAGSPWGNFFRVEGQNVKDGSPNTIFGFGCATTGQRVYGAYQGLGQQNIGTIDYTEMIVRIQRDGAGVGRYSVEIWKPDGSGYLNRSYNSPHAATAVRPRVWQNLFFRGDGTTEIAWIRWYSTTVPEGSAMPKDTGAVPGDLGNWEFEGNLNDSSGNGLHASRAVSCTSSSPCYAPSPVHPPVVQFNALNALAGSIMTLDASQSFTYDGSQITDYFWEQLGGPMRVALQDRYSVRTATNGGIIAGEYSFRLTVRTGGNTISKTDTVKVRNIDVNGFSVLPTNVVRGTLMMSFRLEDVPGAVDVRVTVRKPDGRTLPSVICASSPCELKVDDRQKDHFVQIEYRDAGGNILSTSDWQTVAIAQAERPALASSPFLRPYIKLWALGANSPGIQQQIAHFLSDKSLDFAGGTVVLRNRNPAAVQPIYTDHAGLYPDEIYAFRDSAAAHNYDPERMFLHSAQDYRTTNSLIWSGMDRFDVSEKNAGAYVNGVVLINGSNVVDKTTAAYDMAVADVPIVDKVLIGYAFPFDQVNFEIASPGRGCPVTWEYWNGSSWAPLTLRVDETVADGQLLGKSGKVLFTPPADWAKSVQQGSRSKWWIRISVFGGTTPVASRIYGDDWMTNGNARGWDPNHPGRVNVGLGPLEYNPDPPAGASARFRHQARLLGIWGNNIAMFNLSDVQNGERTVARYVVDRVADKLAAGWNGVWVDNGTPVPQIATPNWQNMTEMAGKSFLAESIESYKEIGAYMRSQYPDYITCTNTSYWALAKEGNCYFDELLKFSYIAPQPLGAFTRFPDDDWRSAGPAALKPENNPKGVVGWIQVYDNANSEFLQGSTWIVWDKAIRGPMTSLASYLMYANENTRFFYHTGPNYWYLSLDEFEYHDATPDWTITSDLMADTGPGEKFVTGDFSSFPSTSSGVMVRMGASGEYVTWKKASDTQLYTTESIGTSYPAGTELFRVKTGHMSSDDLPPLERLRSWGQYFPAMNTDIGIPDEAGHNAGQPNQQWKSPAEAGTLNGIQRRDFTKAIVLFSNGNNVNAPSGMNWSRLNEYGNEIIFAQEGMPETLYPLLPDGSTGPGISSIRLRTGEGVVLMKEPTY